MMNKYFFPHEEIIDIFQEKYYITTIENSHFILLISGLFFQWNVVRIEICVYVVMHQIYL